MRRSPTSSTGTASTSNRLSSTTDGSTTRSFTYSATGAVTEDDRGSGTPYTLVYNDEDRLVEIKQGTTTLATYAHNDLGERVIKTAGSATTHYHYDQAGRLIAESDGTGSVQREVIYLGALPIAQVDSTGVSAQLYRIHADHLGTPRRMTDSSKALVWDAVFKPFGEVQSLTGTATNDNRFQGQRFDATAGYHYNYFRDYDPWLGRYLQSDPIGLEGGLNTYAYVSGNPIQLVDPTGELGLAGGLGEFGWNLAEQLSSNGGNISCLKYRALAGAFILGAINPASSLKWLGRLKELGPKALNQLRQRGPDFARAIAKSPKSALEFIRKGREISFGRNFRIAPFGNRTGHPTGRFPHYHRRGIDQSTGQTKPGQGIKRHRPWDKKDTDQSILDRF